MERRDAEFLATKRGSVPLERQPLRHFEHEATWGSLHFFCFCNYNDIKRDYLSIMMICFPFIHSIDDATIDACIHWLIDWSIGWLIDWLIVWLVSWLIGWLIDWLIVWLVNWLIDWLIDWLVNVWLIDWFIDSSIHWLIDCGITHDTTTCDISRLGPHHHQSCGSIVRAFAVLVSDRRRTRRYSRGVWGDGVVATCTYTRGSVYVCVSGWVVGVGGENTHMVEILGWQFSQG